mmetsp:Transcript_23854/g.34199  ORF Transcript_23854/g.34199 Transcript_23854/m.34199 type:complete len:379 (-) Transcript_23854:61-1197(-)
MVSSLGLFLNVVVLKCCISLTNSFSTLPVEKAAIALFSATAGRLNAPSVISSGSKEFSASNLNKHSTNFDVLKELHETNQFAPFVGSHGVAVVTGGTGGIGFPTVDAIARTGMKVVLCTREDTDQVRCAVNQLHAGSFVSENKIRIQPMDLSDLSSIEAAVAQIARTEGKIDVVLNCAGVNSVPFKHLTAQNFEMQLGVNHIAHHFLTRALLPVMRPWGRVVTVSSQAHNQVRKLVLDDLNYTDRRYCPYGAYCQSKLGNILFSKGLQDKLNAASSDILSLSIHPGRVLTNMWRQSGDTLVGAVSDYVSTKTPEQGSSSIVFGCLADASHFGSGDFLVDCHSTIPSALAVDKQLRNDLWEATESMIQESGFRLSKILL